MPADLYFPEELLSEILKRLPVKSLFRCRYVHKSWYNLIQSPLFITTHLNYQKTHGNNYLLFHSIYGGPCHLALRSDEIQCPEYYTLERLPGFPQGSIWYATSNGLICLADLEFDYHSNIYLWNPAIRKFRTLPDPPPCHVLTVRQVDLAFGFSQKVNDFKVVKLVSYTGLGYKERSAFVQVYGLSSNSWKTHCNDLKGAYNFHSFDCAFVNGTAYFRGITFGRKGVIVSYDTYKDVMRNISLPQQFQAICGHYSLQEFGASLALFLKSSDCICENSLNMWVLKESGTNEEVCWEKKITITLDLAFDWRVLGLRSNGEVILRKLNEYGLVAYNVEKKETRDFVNSWNLWSFVKLCSQSDPFGDDPPPFIVDPFVEGLFLIDEE